MQIQNILYPTDFSPGAQRAFALAALLAHRFGARLHALHVLTLHADLPYDPLYYLPAAGEAYERAEQEAGRRLAALADEPSAQGVVVVPALLRAMRAPDAILAYARQHQIDLIAMGTHGRRGPSRLLLGSTAEEMLRHAPCRVLTVRDEEAGASGPHPLRLERILVPFDFSPSSREALADAADLARHCGAQLRLLHVDEPRLGGPAGAAEQLADALARRAWQLELQLRDILAYVAAGVPGDVVVRSGRPGEVILREADGADVDLVVMATRGISGIKRLLFGSTAEEVLRFARAPVLVVKPEPADSHRSSWQPAWETAVSR